MQAPSNGRDQIRHIILKPSSITHVRYYDQQAEEPYSLLLSIQSIQMAGRLQSKTCGEETQVRKPTQAVNNTADLNCSLKITAHIPKAMIGHTPTHCMARLNIPLNQLKKINCYQHLISLLVSNCIQLVCFTIIAHFFYQIIVTIYETNLLLATLFILLVSCFFYYTSNDLLHK